MGYKILDCTLRDGAYVVDSKFGEKRICDIITTLENAKIDIVECGWLRNCVHEKNSVLYNIPDDAKNYLEASKSKFSLMFDYGRYEVAKLPQNNRLIDIIRIAFYKKSLDEISFVAEEVKNKGYKVYLQPSNVKDYSKNDLIRLCKRANFIGVNACYIVDSFGSMFPEDMDLILPIFEETLDNQIELGFHSHNNIQLSLALSIKFINDAKRNIIIDSTLQGIGRGAGNTKTELLLEYMNRYKNCTYNVDAIWKALDNKLMPDKNWEYTAEKGFRGVNNIHP